MNQNGSEFAFENVRLSITTIGDFIRATIADWSAMFREDILLGANLRVDLEDLHDVTSDRTPGYSFASDPRNHPAAWRDKLAVAWEQAGTQARFRNADGTWNIAGIQEWIGAYDRFKVRTAAIFQWCLGLPPRGEETLTTRYRNSGQTGLVRHIIVMRGHLCVYLDYNKTTALTEAHKPILRVMAPAVGEVVALEMLAVHPVRDKFVSILMQNEAVRRGQPCAPLRDSLCTKLFTVGAGEDILAAKVSAEMQKLTEAGLGIRLGLADSRQIMVHIARDQQKHVEEFDATAAQAGHSSAVAHAVYAVTDQHTQQASAMQLLAFFEKSKEVHYLLGLDKRDETSA